MVEKLEFSCRTLLNNCCVVRTQTFQTFTLLYLTPLVYLRLWFCIRMPKLKRAEAGSLSKSERQRLQRLYTQGGAAYGSVRNLVKASILSVSKVRQFLHFYIQNFPLQNLLLPHVNSRAWKHLLDSEKKFGVWTWHTLIN